MSPSSNIDLRLPAEWEAQDAVMVTWPDEDSNWGASIVQVERTLTTLVNTISQFERVIVACANPVNVKKLFANGKGNSVNIILYPVRSNDLWARDHGPITVYENGKAKLLNFRFNGWGGKYPYALDNRINESMAQEGAWPLESMESLHLTLEGGAVESDGQGTLLLNSKCVLNPSRNGAISQEEVEKELTKYLGAKRILWVHHGELAGDDTDGHIDTLARFCSPDTIAYTVCTNSEEPHFRALQALESELKRLQTSTAKPYVLIPFPLPSPIFDNAGEPLPANYANFLIINGAVLVPTYNDPMDAPSLEKMAGLFPDRKIIGIDCCQAICQFGAIHCMTMQLPMGSIS